MEQNNGTMYVVEINTKWVRHELGEAIFTDTDNKVRMFSSYELAKKVAEFEYKCWCKIHGNTYEDYKKGDSETYTCTDIWVNEYHLTDMGEYLYKDMKGHYTSWDFQCATPMSHIAE